MSTIDLLLAIHNHQPVGNFGHVFEEAYETCYKPQTEILFKHPDVKMALHHTGSLLEWIESNRPEYFDMVGKMVERGQVEILSGGFYEPILSSIPEDDAIGQIVMMNEYIKKRFGTTPTGMWTAERVWDPSLPKIISSAGLSYTLLDDTHFYYAGLNASDMFGYYVTEKHGKTVSIFPIDKNLRYTIPFSQPHETIDYLKRMKDELSVDCVTYGDDGEKFGVWPDTYKWVYEDGWLDKFYSALQENGESVRTTLFSEFMQNNPPRGRIYLPLASYEEMMEWALPSDSGKKFHEVLSTVDDMGKRDEWKPFIRGGIWDNFFAKYDESNRMHKKMIYVSNKITDAEHSKRVSKRTANSARKKLYQGQCNCAYWHGLFGGLYLNSLRHAIYEKLIEAEKIVDLATHKTKSWLSVERGDFDMDGQEDIIFSNPDMTALFDPDYGGSLSGLDYKPANFSISNTFTRREEAYHQKLNEEVHGKESKAPASIHDIVRVKEEGLSNRLQYDKMNRRSFQEKFLAQDVSMNSFARQEYDELGDFGDKPFEINKVEKKRDATLTMSRHGLLTTGGRRQPISIEKVFTVKPRGAEILASYKVSNFGAESISCRMGVEFNLTLLASDADDRYWLTKKMTKGKKLKESIEDRSVKTVGMRDEWSGFDILISSDTTMDAWKFPIETVSQSESGFERIYQGSCIFMSKIISLPTKGSFEFTMAVKINKL